MELRTVGASAVIKGQLLTLFVNDPSNPINQQFTMLYVKESFSVSEEMAEFYKTLPPEHRAMPSEISTDQFYKYLVKKGLVDRPKSDVVHVGHFGKVPERIVDEFKHSLNPTEYTISKVRNALMYQSCVFQNHQGYRILLLGPTGSMSEVVVEVWRDGEELGAVNVGIVFDRTLDAVINEDDIKIIRDMVMKMITEVEFLPGLHLERIHVNLAPLVK